MSIYMIHAEPDLDSLHYATPGNFGSRFVQSVQTGALLGTFPTRLTADAAGEAHHPNPLVAYVQQRLFITRKPPLGLGLVAGHTGIPQTCHHTASQAC
ncbi:hypothetical protein RB213_008585 [Colletotrichum asianum]